MKTEILQAFTFGDVSVVAERVVGRRDIYRLRVERVAWDDEGPVTRHRHLFETKVGELERLSADLSRAAIRMNHWLQEYARVRHGQERPETKSALGLRLGE